MISSSVICATRPRALSSSYRVMSFFLLFCGQRDKKTPPAKINLAEGEKCSRYHLCLPFPHGSGLTSACPRVGRHSCVCNARTRHSLLESSLIQLTAPGGISPAALHAPCTDRDLSGQSASGYLFPSSPFNKSQCSTIPETCQSRVSLSARPSISRALARESSVTWSPEMMCARASTRPS